MTASQFALVKEPKGDRCTYCNMYNGNPHLDFGRYNDYLYPSVGQFNINCGSMK
jgi:hypothetical protein